MALQVASLYGVLRMDDAQFRQSLQNTRSGMGNLGGVLKRLGSRATTFGGELSVMTAPIALGIGVAIKGFTDFDEAVTNIQAVTGQSDAEIQKLADDLLNMGSRTVHGPQAVANAMYDIVGGVADASTHMNILVASMLTATAGNADLGGTTKALISVMNAYRFSANKAGFVSDVLTRTVGMGVGTMDEFASALPQVTGLANSLGISFDDLGAMTAYLTTQGNSASQATTQLAAMMTALLNPNETMKKGLEELGFSSGQAAIAALGLTGAFEALAGTQTANSEGMAKMSGSVEALRGITSMAGPDVEGFFAKFKSGVNSATDAAGDIQMDSAANQFALLRSNVEGLGIQIGQILVPILLDLVEKIRPIISDIRDWIEANPELARNILIVGGALVIAGPLIMGVGLVLSGLGTIVGVVTAAFGLLLSPVGLLIVGIGGLLYVLNSLYPGGLPKLLMDAATSARQLAIIGLGLLSVAANWARERLRELLQTILDIIEKINQLKQGLSAWGGVGSNLATALGMGASPGDFLSALGRAIGQEFGGNRDGGGPGAAGQAYMIGTGAQPEMFIPSTSGTFVPNADRQGGTQMHFGAGSVVIQANSRAEGAAAADGWWQRMEELRRAQG